MSVWDNGTSNLRFTLTQWSIGLANLEREIAHCQPPVVTAVMELARDTLGKG